MSQRSRGRGTSRNASAHHGEEVTLWETCFDNIKKTVSMVNEDNQGLAELLALDAEAARLSQRDEPPEFSTLTQMETLCRNGVRRQEDVAVHIKNLVEQLDILKGVQQAKEQSAGDDKLAVPGSLRGSSSRIRGEAASGSSSAAAAAAAAAASVSSLYDVDTISAADSSATASPVAGPVSATRRGLSERLNRDSIPPTAGSSSTDEPPPGVLSGSAAVGLPKSKTVFAKGDLVAFRQKVGHSTQGSDWILGEVAQVLGDGKSRRYKVIDIEPEETSKQKEYRSSASNMIYIAPESQVPNLPGLESGTVVLALYPNTTTFYKAEVMSMTSDGGKVNLRFEGEHDSETMQQVERQYVIEFRA